MDQLNKLKWYYNSKHSTNNTWGCLVSNGKMVLALSNETNGSIFNCLNYSDSYNYNSYTSTYLNNWKSIKYDPIKNIFIAVGNSNVNCIMTTSDGTSWKNYLALEGSWNDIICNSYNKMYYVVGNNINNGFSGMMTGTTDLLNSEILKWKSVTVPTGGWTSIASTGTSIPVNNSIVNPFILVVVSNVGPNYLMYSLDSGKIWTLSNTQIAGSWVKVIYENNLFVAISNVGPKYVIYSLDGKSWSSSISQPSGNWNDISYGNGMFIIVDKSETNKTHYSFDARNWYSSSIPATNHIVFNSNYFISFGNENSLNTFLYNPSNTSTIIPFNNNLIFNSQTNIIVNNKTHLNFSYNIEHYFTNTCIYGNKQFFSSLVSTRNNISTSSTNSISVISKINQNTKENQTYTINTNVSIFNRNIVSGVYGNGLYVFISDDGDVISSSNNGAKFTSKKITIVGETKWLKIVYGKGIFIILTSISIMYSTDTITWIPYSLPSDNSNSNNKNVWSQICYGNKYFTILPVNLTNGILYSTDGKTWTKGTMNFQLTSVSTTLWNTIVYGDKFVAINASNAVNNIMYSDNGITWNLSKAPTDDWSSVAYGEVYNPNVANEYFYIACSSKDLRFMYSSNGITWYGFFSNFDKPYNPIYSYINASNIIVYGNYSFVLCSPSYNITINGTTLELLTYVNQYFIDYDKYVSGYSESQNETSSCSYDNNKQALKDIIELVEKPFSINYNITNDNGDIDNVSSILSQKLSLPGFSFDSKYEYVLTSCGEDNKNYYGLNVCATRMGTTRKRINIQVKIGKLNLKVWKTKYYNFPKTIPTKWFGSRTLTYKINIGNFDVLSLPSCSLGIVSNYSNTYGNISGSMFYDPPVSTPASIASDTPINNILSEALGVNLVNVSPTAYDSIILSLSKYITTKSPEIFSKAPNFSEKTYTKYQFKIDNSVSQWYNNLVVDTIAISNFTVTIKQMISINLNHPLFSFTIPNLVIDIPEINLLDNVATFDKSFPIIIRPFSKAQRTGITIYSKMIIGIPGLIKCLADACAHPSLLIPQGSDFCKGLLFQNLNRQIQIDGLREVILILEKLNAFPEVKKILDGVSFFLRYSLSLKYCFSNKTNPLYLQFKIMIYFNPFNFIKDLLDIANIAIGQSFNLYNEFAKWIKNLFNTDKISETNPVAAKAIDAILVSTNTIDDNVKWNKNCMQNILNKLSILQDASFKKVFKYSIPLPIGDGKFNLTAFGDTTSTVSSTPPDTEPPDTEPPYTVPPDTVTPDSENSNLVYNIPSQSTSIDTTINSTTTDSNVKNVFNYTAPNILDNTDTIEPYNLDEYGSYPTGTIYTYPPKHFDIGDDDNDDDVEILTPVSAADYEIDFKKNHKNKDSTFKTTFVTIQETLQ